jgi:hypothetical protein
MSFSFTGGGFGSDGAQVKVLNPDGTTLVGPTYCGVSCTIAATALATSGTYTIQLIPQATTFGSLTVSISAS